MYKVKYQSIVLKVYEIKKPLVNAYPFAYYKPEFLGIKYDYLPNG